MACSGTGRVLTVSRDVNSTYLRRTGVCPTRRPDHQPSGNKLKHKNQFLTPGGCWRLSDVSLGPQMTSLYCTVLDVGEKMSYPLVKLVPFPPMTSRAPFARLRCVSRSILPPWPQVFQPSAGLKHSLFPVSEWPTTNNVSNCNINQFHNPKQVVFSRHSDRLARTHPSSETGLLSAASVS